MPWLLRTEPSSVTEGPTINTSAIPVLMGCAVQPTASPSWSHCASAGAGPTSCSDTHECNPVWLSPSCPSRTREDWPGTAGETGSTAIQREVRKLQNKAAAMLLLRTRPQVPPCDSHESGLQRSRLDQAAYGRLRSPGSLHFPTLATHIRNLLSPAVRRRP